MKTGKSKMRAGLISIVRLVCMASMHSSHTSLMLVALPDPMLWAWRVCSVSTTSARNLRITILFGSRICGVFLFLRSGRFCRFGGCFVGLFGLCGCIRLFLVLVSL